jgi:outer membrane receptor for ferrienterochelin and colicin
MKYTLIFFVTIFQFLALSAQVDLEVLALDANTAKGIEGLKVRLENEQIGFQAELPTNFQGKVRFSGLKVADGYVVRTSETETYQQISETGISLRTNQHPSITLLVPNKLSLDLEEVEIKAFSISRINTVNAEVASELTRKEITTLPIEGRDITRALYRLPNVTQATGFYPEAPNVAINGANSLFTNYMIDGMDNNERFLGGQKFSIPVGFTQNITVLTNNYSTEFGLTGNGIINLTSRSGSNELSGEAFYLTRPGPVIDASSPYAQRDLSGNQVKDGFMRQQAGFGIGGALKKDKTFYYLNAEQTLDFKDNLLNVPQLGVNETVSGMNRFTYLSGKLDHRWSDRFRSSLRVNAGLINIERQGGGLEGGVTFPSAGNSQDRNSLLIASKNMYLGENFSSETNLQYSRFRWNYGRPTNGPGPQVTVLDPQEQTLAVLGHPGFIFDETENTLQFQQKFNFYLGQHRLKVGAEVISADHSLFGGGNVNGNYLVKLTENQLASLQGQNLGSALGANDLPSNVEVLGYNVELQPTSFGTRQNIFSLYVEDLISLSSRFNLTLGLRYDYDNLSKGGAEQGDFNNLAPRTSFNYKLGKRSSLRGG